LQSACADDGELLSRVESLLASHKGESRFLQTPVGEQLGDNITEGNAATIVTGTGSTQDESPSSDAGSVLDFSRPQERNKMAEETPLGYLEPSTKPGSLGRLAHYEILEVIGRGTFGTVLRAFDDKLQRVVAIKVMAPELAATSPARKRFIREAQASAAIRHENVVSSYAVEERPLRAAEGRGREPPKVAPDKSGSPGAVHWPQRRLAMFRLLLAAKSFQAGSHSPPPVAQ
jgi:hypothetical protein